MMWVVPGVSPGQPANGRPASPQPRSAAREPEDSKLIYHGSRSAPPPARQQQQQAQPEKATAQTFKRDEQKVGRNDPCPCGSGKKFKKCHGAGTDEASV